MEKLTEFRMFNGKAMALYLIKETGVKVLISQVGDQRLIYCDQSHQMRAEMEKKFPELNKNEIIK